MGTVKKIFLLIGLCMIAMNISACGLANGLKREAVAMEQALAPSAAGAGAEANTKPAPETEAATQPATEVMTQPATEAMTQTAEEAVTEAVTEAAAEKMTEAPAPVHTVAIDPGHQGSWVDMSAPEPMAPGSSETKPRCSTGTEGNYTGVPEYQLNLDISLALRDELEKRGYAVVMTREDNDANISNIERAQLAAERGAEACVRIHANSSTDPSVHGALGMVMSPDNPYVGHLYEQSFSLAQNVLNSFCSLTGFDSMGVECYDDMTGFNWSQIPVTILEMGFMSNEHDDYAMQDPAMQEKMVQGIANGIDAYFGYDSTAARARAEAGDAESGAAGDAAETDTEMAGIAGLIYEQYIAAREVSGEHWGVAVKDPASGTLYTCHGTDPLQSASVIKLFIMGTVYERICYPASEQEQIWFSESYEGELRQLLEEMIQVSSNEATNRLIDILGEGDPERGKAAVNDFCKKHGFIGTHLGRKMLESEPKDDNYTSAADAAEILSEIAAGKLVNAEASGKMLTILQGQTVRHKIPAGLPEGYTCANKTGEMPEGYGLGCIENDAAIIWPPQGDPYVLVVLSNDLGGKNEEAQEVIRQISAYTAGALRG